jgi:general secretion pathway protein G
MRPTSSRRNRGFTLIEVLLVLVILVVLASLAVMAYAPVRRQANVHSAKVQVEMLKQAVEAYELGVHSYPSTGSGLQALRMCPGDIGAGHWDGPYLERDIPLDPWGQPYQYLCPGRVNTQTFDIWTVDPTTQQEIGNWTQEVH